MFSLDEKTEQKSEEPRCYCEEVDNGRDLISAVGTTPHYKHSVIEL